MPEESVTHRVDMVPNACLCGSTHLEKTANPPRRHQVVDIPPIKPEVIEYTQYTYRCCDCGELVYKPLPDEIEHKHFGPGLLALVGILTGSLNTSKRKALAFINDFCNIPMSLGGLSACEEQVSKALEKPYQELRECMEQQPVGHADETGWSRGNLQKGWLWVLCCTTLAVFIVQSGRSQKQARQLLGKFKGILHTDRWVGYNMFKGLRQLCWAHLKRDFTSLSEVKGKMGVIGLELVKLTGKITHLRNQVRDGDLEWPVFQKKMEPLMKRVETLLEEGASSGEPLSGKCLRIYNQREHLWTFVRHEQVEPTNNLAERMVRQAVLWRKGSFGTQSERGARYAERILSVCATCRLHNQSIIDYLRDACKCHLNWTPVPSVIQLSKFKANVA